MGTAGEGGNAEGMIDRAGLEQRSGSQWGIRYIGQREGGGVDQFGLKRCSAGAMDGP